MQYAPYIGGPPLFQGLSWTTWRSGTAEEAAQRFCQLYRLTLISVRKPDTVYRFFAQSHESGLMECTVTRQGDIWKVERVFS